MLRAFTKSLFLSAIAASALSGAWNRSAQAATLAESAPGAARSEYKTDVLIYAGDAAAYGDPEALEQIASSHKLTTRSVTSEELNQMTADELSQYGVIAWPGGYAGVQSSSLTKATRDNIQKAVHERGVGFIGFCAGAFIAVSPDTKSGLSVVTAPELEYYHLEDEGTDDAMVGVKMNDGSQRQLVWWGGPYLPEWQGGVIARYSDNGQPAIAQTWAGSGLVVLAGPHPEAPEDWRTKLGLTDSDGLDQEIAYQMMVAAMNRQPMPSS